MYREITLRHTLVVTSLIGAMKELKKLERVIMLEGSNLSPDPLLWGCYVLLNLLLGLSFLDQVFGANGLALDTSTIHSTHMHRAQHTMSCICQTFCTL